MAPRLSLEEMTEHSELIVHGRVVKTWSAWDANHQCIWTHNEIQVFDALKGAPGSIVTVSEPGGLADGMELKIAGIPRYNVGEEALVFAHQTPIGLWRTRGLGQGKFAIVRDMAGVLRVHAELRGLALAEPPGAAMQSGTDLRRLEGMPLAEFKTKVRTLASRVKGVR